MTNSTRRTIPAVAAAALSMGAAAAWADAPAQNLAAQIDELKAKVQALETQQVAQQKDVNATIDAVLRDAEKRSQLLAEGTGVTSGYEGNRFFVRSGDGSFSLNPSLQFQFRYIANWGEDTKRGTDDSIEDGFEVRRMKFEFGGHLFTPDLTYFFQWASNRNEGSVELEDAWVRYMFADQWGVRLGQFKDPVFHEELVSSKRQLAAERSLANELLGGGQTDRVQGISLLYGGYKENNPLYGEVVFHDGADTANTGALTQDAHYGISARVEYKLMGDWRSYGDFSAMNNKNDLLVVGAGVDYSEYDDLDTIYGSADVQWENTAGLGVYAALLAQYADPEAGDDSTNWGAVLQAGYLLNPRWEIFGRGSMVLADEDFVFANGDTEDTFYEVTFGVNYFMFENAGHRAKITVDVGYLFNGSPAGVSGAGYNDGPEDQIVVRGQFQLLI